MPKGQLGVGLWRGFWTGQDDIGCHGLRVMPQLVPSKDDLSHCDCKHETFSQVFHQGAKVVGKTYFWKYARLETSYSTLHQQFLVLGIGACAPRIFRLVTRRSKIPMAKEGPPICHNIPLYNELRRVPTAHGLFIVHLLVGVVFA